MGDSLYIVLRVRVSMAFEGFLSSRKELYRQMCKYVRVDMAGECCD